MDNRLKFRAYLTCPVTQENGEEKDISFYIYDVAVYSDGGINFTSDDLFEALSKLNLTEKQKEEIEQYIYTNSLAPDPNWFVIDFGIPEQCTGIRDMDGNLVYEGDLVNCFEYDRDIFKVIFTYEEVASCGCCYEAFVGCGFVMQRLDSLERGKLVDDNKRDNRFIKVIGNIHEPLEKTNDHQ